MAVLTVSEIQDLALDRIQANVATDPAFTAAEILRHINDAYADVFEMSGGAIKRSTGSTMWTPQPSTGTVGIFRALVTTIGEIKELFHSTLVTSDGDHANGDQPLGPVDLSEILYMRSTQTLFGSYVRPKLYALTRNFSTASGDLQLDVWPGVAASYFPAHYIPMFTPLDAATVTIPSVNDIESRDIALLAASRMAPLTGRAELVPGILADISQRTAEAMERKLSSLMNARADK